MGGTLGSLLGLLMKNVLTAWAESVLVTLGLTAAVSAVDAGTQEKLRSGTMTLIISNEELRDIMKIVKSLKDSVLLIKNRYPNDKK